MAGGEFLVVGEGVLLLEGVPGASPLGAFDVLGLVFLVSCGEGLLVLRLLAFERA